MREEKQTTTTNTDESSTAAVANDIEFQVAPHLLPSGRNPIIAMAALLSFFERRLGEELPLIRPRLNKATAEKCEDRRYALDLVLKEGDISINGISTLQFAQSVLDYTNSDLDISGWLLNDLKVTTPLELADVLYPRSKFVQRDGASRIIERSGLQTLQEICSRFFDDHPTLAVQVVLRSGQFSSLSETVQKVAESMISCLERGNMGNDDAQLMEETRFALMKGEAGIQPSETDLYAALAFTKSMILLSRVVDDPEDLPFLHEAGIASVRQITQQLKGKFAEQMVAKGMEMGNALKVHDSAERVDCWNEQLWLSIMQSSRDDCLPISTERPSALSGGQPTGRSLSNLTDIFKLEETDCEECCSVTGLSAYLSDLLLLLRNTTFINRTPKLLSDETPADNLLDVLFERRPDIRKLELTCANSQTLLPYISLVNEVLESYIRSVAPKPIAPSDRFEDSIRAYQTPTGFEEGQGPTGAGPATQYRPANTDYPVYQKLVSKATYPFTCFPYDLASNIEGAVFGTYQLDFVHFLRIFQSPQRLLDLVPRSRRGPRGDRLDRALLSGAKATLKRRLAAETLGLQQAEYSTITSETFFPATFADLANGLSQVPLSIDKECPNDVASLWGFDDEATMLDPFKGLSLIKNQLMFRSGLEFDEILELVKTRCFSQHLIITNASGSSQFGPLVEGLLLLSNAAAPPYQPLTAKLSFSLQAFLRLRNKLSWSIVDTDAAIVGFRDLELSMVVNTRRTEKSVLPQPIAPAVVKKSEDASKDSDEKSKLQKEPPPLFDPNEAPVFNSAEIVSITPFVVSGIAALSRLSKLSGISTTELLPIWTPINTFGDKSLFHRKFMTKRLQQIDDIYSPFIDTQTTPPSAKYLTTKGVQEAVGNHAIGICAALQWPMEHFDKLVAASSCRDQNLDIGVFTALYRHAIICRILSVPPNSCEAFFKVFYAHSSPAVLADPMYTVDVIEDWKLLLNSGWTVESLVSILGQKGQTNTVTETRETKEAWFAGLRLALDISTGAQKIEQSIPYTLPGAVLSASDVVDCASRVFDASTAKSVVDLVESSVAVPDAICQKFPLAQKVSDAIALLDQTTPSSSTIETVTPASGGSNEGMSTVDDDAIADAKATEDARLAEQASLNATIQLHRRRAEFIKVASPAITEALQKTFLVDTVKVLLPDTDPVIILPLLADIVKVQTIDGKSEQAAISALQDLKHARNDVSTADRLDAYFAAPTSDNFTLKYTGPIDKGQAPPTLSVDGIDVPYDPDAKSFTPFRLTGGKYYRLKASFGAKAVTWSTPKSSSTAFSDDVLKSVSIARRAATIIDAIKRIASLCTIEQLKPEELQYMILNRHKAGQTLVVNFDDVRLADLTRLVKFRQLRQSVTGNIGSLASLVGWLGSVMSPTLDDIATRFADATGWKKASTLEALEAQCSGLPAADVLSSLKSFEGFLGFADIMLFNDELQNASSGGVLPKMSVLFDLAKPKTTLSSSKSDYDRAIALQDGLTPSQKTDIDVVLTQTRRKVLVEYLLQQEKVRDELKIVNADGLFELFLIDVQMGPQLRTSRIKQAISVVQLFVQRCFLGIEADIAKDMLPREKWTWMQHYTLWEAHRKMFLYPENWLEPSLRDDKSQLFEKLETILMQKDLSVSTFVRAVQDYSYDLNGISSLDIVSYLHEPHPGAEDIFHLFGRTRVAPHTFYYRTLTIYHSDSAVFWKPWIKMEIDIPSVENDWDSTRLQDSGAYLVPIFQEGRLYIFFPQVILKTVNTSQLAAGPQSQTWTQMGDAGVAVQEPKQQWEVTMAWSELVRGTWTPKRVSPGSLLVDAPTSAAPKDKPVELPPQGRLPSAWQFRLDPIFETNRVRIALSHAPKEAHAGQVVGSFDFSTDQVTACQTTDIKVSSHEFCTHFGKVTGDKSSLFVPGVEDKKNAPLVWLPSKIKQSQSDIKWTLSKSAERVTGLVMNVKQADGSSVSYFNVPEKDLLSTSWTQEMISSNMALTPMDHPFSQSLMQAAVNRADPLKSIYDTMAAIPAGQLGTSFGLVGGDTFYHELATPSALYNWELGVHAVMLATDRFLATQQYDDALQIARLLFDPTVDTKVQRDQSDPKTGKTGNDVTKSAWRFPPFQDISERIGKAGDTSPNLKKLAEEIELAIKERRSFGQLVHAAARGRPQAYMKWIVMKYAEILLAAGDDCFRQGTLEKLPLAIQRYTEAAHVLGPEPIKGLKLGRKAPKCFEDIIDDEVRINLSLPFSAQLKRIKDSGKGSATSAELDARKEALRSFIMTPYFSVPLNPKFKKLRSLVHERLYNIRNSLDINGNPVTYALREPPIDPAALVALGAGLGGSISDTASAALGNQNGPLPRYRFEMRLQKALELCSELRSMAERIMTAVEKKEADEFSAMRARNASVIQSLMLDMKRTSLSEAKQTMDSLQLSRDSQAAQLSFYLATMGETTSTGPKAYEDWIDIEQDIGPVTQDDLRMSVYEKTEMDLSGAAAGLNIIAAGIDHTASMFAWLPSISGNVAPLGIGCSVSAGGSTISGAIQIDAMSMKADAMIVSEASNEAARKGRMVKQLQERRLQANIRGREIRSTDQQMLIQRTRIAAAEQDINTQLASMQDAAQAEAYYRTKYTSQQLYAWMEKELRGLYFQAYTLAAAAAQQAVAALSFEQGRPVGMLRPAGYWNASRDGLLAADNLYMDLKRLEAIHLEGRRSDYEVTKTISLRQLDPLALLRLRITGVAEFSIPEVQYDMDFPGHYMRRIRSVAVSIPAVIGPTTGLNATLTLTQHQYRVSPLAGGGTAKDYLSTTADAFRSDAVPVSSVAISSGTNDAGVFELDYTSTGKYMPFEGAGAISSWRLRLPSQMRRFDYESISDVLLHVQYTSLDGGELLKSAAESAVKSMIAGVESEGRTRGFFAMFDLRNDFVNAWHSFQTGMLASSRVGGKASGTLQLDGGGGGVKGGLKSRLPHWSRSQPRLVVKTVMLACRNAKLVRGMTIPDVVGEQPTVDETRIGTGSTSVMLRTFGELSVDNLDGWTLKASGVPLGDKVDRLDNIYMLIEYVFG
ncbi:hypothetical protein PFICI_00947 [Pestalotiopsis fici W106-1]|uniref:Uncharacterized protein n=1 Tax=Pestalotiopsis fici (strain W106-1 / CGMCC3.15140) TaxID=1229662 RepID=W3XM99_PESFW|nr:uncharacterized protein PFICI_00947 [Pestalotiopsis fici W106-1]ETS87119.1 hypothetical protein PFICI_00947 [Pestalotiopsis fici W106-1]